MNDIHFLPFMWISLQRGNLSLLFHLLFFLFLRLVRGHLRRFILNLFQLLPNCPPFPPHPQPKPSHPTRAAARQG